MKQLADVSTDGYISLSKLTDRRVADVVGWLSGEWGTEYPTFIVSHIVFDDGTRASMGGEHDMPFIEWNYRKPLVSNEQMVAIYRENTDGY